MPLVADHADLGRLDATDIDVELWRTRIHYCAAPLRCPECRHRMVAVVSSTGLRHFRHYRRPARCELYGETPTHRAIKREVLAAIRSLPGWTAEPEVPGDGWRADVLASGPDGRRIAWEVQVSGIGADTAAERTARLNASGVEVCWLPLTTRHALRDLPCALIKTSSEGSTVVKHAEVFDTRWVCPRVDLSVFVANVCRATVFWAPRRSRSTTGAWTTAADLAKAAEKEEASARDSTALLHERRTDDLDRSKVKELGHRIDVFSYSESPEERVRQLIAWQNGTPRGWDAMSDPPPW